MMERQDRIRGMTYHGGLLFDVPLMTEVASNLWFGGVRDGIILPDYFKTVFSLYDRERYTMPEGAVRVVAPLLDGAEIPEELDELAKSVNMARDVGPVLVHCQAGLNRSALVTARALMLKEGWTGQYAVNHLRAVRGPAVLCNSTFYDWLVSPMREVE